MSYNTTKMTCDDRTSYSEQLEKVMAWKNTNKMVLTDYGAMYIQGSAPQQHVVKASLNTHSQFGQKAKMVGRLRAKLQAKKMAEAVPTLSDA